MLIEAPFWRAAHDRIRQPLKQRFAVGIEDDSAQELAGHDLGPQASSTLA